LEGGGIIKESVAFCSKVFLEIEPACERPGEFIGREALRRESGLGVIVQGKQQRGQQQRLIEDGPYKNRLQTAGRAPLLRKLASASLQLP
jgi:hypothetical protein